jgi:branched-chain amino acid transport system substrate-binding protein
VKFVAAYKAKSGKVPTSFVAEGYDAVWLLARGLKAAGSKDRAKLRDGIEQVTKQGYAGAQGPLTFENRDVRGPGLLIIIHNGKDELQQ